jgi:hypothetical protein
MADQQVYPSWNGMARRIRRSKEILRKEWIVLPGKRQRG